MRHDIIGSAHGHQPEEQQYEQIAPAVVGERKGARRIKESEDHAKGAEQEQFPPAVTEQAAADKRCRNGCHRNRPTHRPGRYPPHSAGAGRPEPLSIVGAFEEIVQVVNQVGIYLHQQSESHAQHCLRPCEKAVGSRERTSGCNRHGRRCKRPETGGCKKSPEAVYAYRFCRHGKNLRIKREPRTLPNLAAPSRPQLSMRCAGSPNFHPPRTNPTRQ